MTSDIVKVTLRDESFAFADSISAVLDETGNGLFTFVNTVSSTPYWIGVTHRSGVETWSSSAVIIPTSTLNYDFTTGTDKAYGDNMVAYNGKYCFFTGDVNHDGIVDGSDNVRVFNLAKAYSTDYVPEDVNGDGIVDGSDNVLVFNNAKAYVSPIFPDGYTPPASVKNVNHVKHAVTISK
jgi:hypothetical protein